MSSARTGSSTSSSSSSRSSLPNSAKTLHSDRRSDHYDIFSGFEQTSSNRDDPSLTSSQRRSSARSQTTIPSSANRNSNAAAISHHPHSSHTTTTNNHKSRMVHAKSRHEWLQHKYDKTMKLLRQSTGETDHSIAQSNHHRHSLLSNHIVSSSSLSSSKHITESSSFKSRALDYAKKARSAAKDLGDYYRPESDPIHWEMRLEEMNVAILMNLGNAFSLNDKWDEATACFQRTLERIAMHNGGSASAATSAAGAPGGTGLISSTTMELCDQLLCAKIYANLGQMKLRQGQVFAAIRFFHRALSGRFNGGAQKIISSAVHGDSSERSIQSDDTSMHSDSESMLWKEFPTVRARLLDCMAGCLVKIGQYSDAAECYENALECHPSDCASALNAVLCHFALGDSERMRSAFQSLLDTGAELHFLFGVDVNKSEHHSRHVNGDGATEGDHGGVEDEDADDDADEDVNDDEHELIGHHSGGSDDIDQDELSQILMEKWRLFGSCVETAAHIIAPVVLNDTVVSHGMSEEEDDDHSAQGEGGAGPMSSGLDVIPNHSNSLELNIGYDWVTEELRRRKVEADMAISESESGKSKRMALLSTVGLRQLSSICGRVSQDILVAKSLKCLKQRNTNEAVKILKSLQKQFKDHHYHYQKGVDEEEEDQDHKSKHNDDFGLFGYDEFDSDLFGMNQTVMTTKHINDDHNQNDDDNDNNNDDENGDGMLEKIHTNLSFISFLENNLEECSKHCSNALSLDRYNALALVNKANVLFMKKDFINAKEIYLEAIGVESDCLEAIFNLGLSCIEIGHYTDALAAFKKLYKMNESRYHSNHSRIGSSKNGSGSSSSSSSHLLISASLSRDPLIVFNIARCYEQIAQVVRNEEEQLTMDDDNHNNHSKLGNKRKRMPSILDSLSPTERLKLSGGDPSEAIKWFNLAQSLLQINRKHPLIDSSIQIHLAQCSSVIQDSRSELEYYLESFRAKPCDLSILAWLGLWYINAELYSDAVIYFERAAIVDPTQHKWKLMVASCHRRLDSFSEAEAIYEWVLAKTADAQGTDPIYHKCLEHYAKMCREDTRDEDKAEELETRLQMIQQRMVKAAVAVNDDGDVVEEYEVQMGEEEEEEEEDHNEGGSMNMRMREDSVMTHQSDKEDEHWTLDDDGLSDDASLDELPL